MYSKVMLSTENPMCKISPDNILISQLYWWCEAHSCSSMRTPRTAHTAARSQPCTAHTETAPPNVCTRTTI